MPLIQTPPQSRESFLAAIEPNRGFDLLLEHLPGILFIAKDLEGKLVAANGPCRTWYDCPDDVELWDTTDFDHLPESLAEKLRRDDLHVTQTGEPILETIEILVDRKGIPTWYLTNKLPIRSRSGEIIGVMSTLQDYIHIRKLSPTDDSVAKGIEIIQKHYASDITIPVIAQQCSLSVRQFERRFKEQTKTTPQDYIVRLRVFMSCEALRNTLTSLADIAKQYGFYDQAAFSKYFKKHIGLSPLQYRRSFA